MRVIQRHQGWLTSSMGDALMMMNIDLGHYVGLNATAARIWELIEAPRAIAEIRNALVDEFDVEAAACERAVEAFVDRLEKSGLVSVTTDP